MVSGNEMNSAPSTTPPSRTPNSCSLAVPNSASIFSAAQAAVVTSTSDPSPTNAEASEVAMATGSNVVVVAAVDSGSPEHPTAP
ncbi:MAG: hypothetical protein V9G14_10440 [Cypionkella sp.]